jgi:hypothetical protein
MDYGVTFGICKFEEVMRDHEALQVAEWAVQGCKHCVYGLGNLKAGKARQLRTCW